MKTTKGYIVEVTKKDGGIRYYTGAFGDRDFHNIGTDDIEAAYLYTDKALAEERAKNHSISPSLFGQTAKVIEAEAMIDIRLCNEDVHQQYQQHTAKEEWYAKKKINDYDEKVRCDYDGQLDEDNPIQSQDNNYSFSHMFRSVWPIDYLAGLKEWAEQDEIMQGVECDKATAEGH